MLSAQSVFLSRTLFVSKPCSQTLRFFSTAKMMRCCQMFPTESFKILPGCSTVATCSSDELLRMYLKMHSEGEFCEEVEWIEDRRRYVIMSS